ncbi:MAG TPA: sugar phosphate isomerase/epimerase family protein [Verrucomicrobiae bacterium]|nr:sugar phosphate isomerase/epimerase family protein [Verrucomicrobiae bacterium]
MSKIKFAICNEVYQGWTLKQAMAHAAATGYDAVEIAPFTLARYVTDISAVERRRIREMAAGTGIAICGIHWVLMHAEGMYLNHNEAAVRQRTAKYLCDLVDFCGDLEGKIIVVGSPKQRNLLPGVTPAQAWDWAADTFRDAVKRAEARGVTLCLEPLAPAETDFINTAAEAIRFAQQFQSANFKIILDVKAMSSESKPIPQIIGESAPHFAHFHANDKNLKGPGFGDIDFRPISAALDEAGYEGYVSVEVFNFEEGAEVIANQSLEYLRLTFNV